MSSRDKGIGFGNLCWEGTVVSADQMSSMTTHRRLYALPKRNREKIRRETRELLQSGVIFKYDGRCVNCVAEAGTLSYVSWSMWTGSLISSSDWTQPDRGHESRHEETAEGCTE